MTFVAWCYIFFFPSSRGTPLSRGNLCGVTLCQFSFFTMFHLRVFAAVRPASSRLLNAATRQFSSASTGPRVIERELPKSTATSRKQRVVGGIVVGSVLWATVLAVSMNYQRTSSSVVNGTLFTVRYDPQVQELLGDKVDYADSWPWVSGSVNHLKGKVDISFDVSGSTG